MERKYNMTKEDNIFFAKRKLVDNIYKSANLEGIAVTFADTVDFLNDVNNGKLSVDNMFKLAGLRDAWQMILSTIDEPLTIGYIKNIHFEVCKAQGVRPLGDFRRSGVGITGTTWRPKLPSECNYEQELKEILDNPDDLDRTIDLFCWIQRSQMFQDGNKRVANLVANKEMIRNGLGILNVPVELIGKYTYQLIKFYETGDNTEIKEFIYNNCLDGINEKEIESDKTKGIKGI